MMAAAPASTITDAPPPVPAKYRRGAKQAWDQRRRHRCVARLLRRVDGKVLDFGCGYGDVTHTISKTHPVEGVDVDEARVAFASEEYAPVRFQVCAPDGVSYPEEAFDIVTSVAVIHFVPDPTEYLREIRRVLRPGGHVILVCRNVSYVWNAFRRLSGRKTAASDLWIRSRAEVLELLAGEGFDVTAESYFNNPPFESWSSLPEVCVGTVEQLLALLRVRHTCDYFAMLARKI